MNLWEYSGENVRIEMDDGQIFEGRAYDYMSAYDNEPYPESITIDSTELFANEIKKIEIMD